MIAVPTTELIINKTNRTDAGTSLLTFNGNSQEVYGLFGKFDTLVKDSLSDYLIKEGIKKIICTYDKVPKLLDYIEPKNYRVLIDEYHCLLKAYSYRQKAIDGVLDNFRQFKSFSSCLPPQFSPLLSPLV